MKKSLYLYLFIFAALIALILYVNGRKMQSALENQVLEMRAENNKLNTKLVATEVATGGDNLFTMNGNQEAADYFANKNVDVSTLETTIFNELLELNATKTGNSLIPYTSASNGYRIQDIRVVNHKWVLANFSDSKDWGEVLLEYNVNAAGKVTFTTLQALLYE